VTGSLGSGNPGQSPNSALGGSVPYDRTTAVYDISKHMVYMPDGTRLEAHSGLGSKLDDPRYVNVRMLGPTPPHVYDLQPRETLFHGVPALRLNPVGGEDAIFGRTGLLAHTYMLGPQRRFQRLRFVQGLQRVPAGLPERRGQTAGRGHARGVSGQAAVRGMIFL